MAETDRPLPNPIKNTMNPSRHDKNGTPSPGIRIRYESPDERMFVGEEVGLLVSGVIADVVAHEIWKPASTLISEDGATYAGADGSMKGTVYGKGPVRCSHHEAFLTVKGKDHSFVPHGNFEELSAEESKIREPATWKFTFPYSIKPCGCAGS
ncbi:hypothetical protein GCM10023212_00090 [Luteolibacter yonseiensis]